MTALKVFRKNRYRARPGQVFQFDYWLALSVGGLAVIGMLMVYSTTFDYGLRFYDDATYFIQRQLIALLIGFVAIVFFMQFDYQVLRRGSVFMMVGTLAMLLFVLLFGEAIFGARRGLYGGSFQPSEIAKVATILYIAHWISSKGDRIKDLTYGLVPFSMITGIVCALIVLQPDLGTSVLIAGIAFALFFIAGADLRQFGIAGVMGGAIFIFLINVLPHAAERIDYFKQGLVDPIQGGWHVQQSVVALGTGGFLGVGLGESTQKFGPLPAAHTDGVFAVLGEELGLLGCLVVILLFGIFTWRGIRTALNARDSYGFLLALGITCWLAFQALINMAVIVAVFPFTGMPLPFMSYGGSSMAISLIGVAILLNISRDATLNIRAQGRKPIRETIREGLNMRGRDGRSHLPGSVRR
ncbi:MAG TPA: putative lipid II flippase FtsW [candidate division Zixibacteria bacterium]|nr:putative lipid II flippase FtsW [candidate division Zixibacteria bacterium]